MQNQERVMSPSLKSLLFGVGGLVIFIVEVASLFFGISDGSLMFIVPLLISPFISVFGIVFGVKAIRKNVSSRGMAIAGVVSGIVSILIIIIVTVLVLTWVSGLAGVY